MSDLEVRANDVRREHLAEVNVVHQWLYLVAVPGLGLIIMLVLLALLDTT